MFFSSRAPGRVRRTLAASPNDLLADPETTAAPFASRESDSGARPHKKLFIAHDEGREASNNLERDITLICGPKLYPIYRRLQ